MKPGGEGAFDRAPGGTGVAATGAEVRASPESGGLFHTQVGDRVPTAASSPIVIEDWGLVSYDEALRRQLDLHARRVAGEAADTLVVVTHPPTFTLGRHAPEADIVLDQAQLARRGIAVARSDRGGRATYHGPGQVVLYPIVSIAELGLGVKDWVCLLESALIDTLAHYGVPGRRHPGTAGIWTCAHDGEAAGAGHAGTVSPGTFVAAGDAGTEGTGAAAGSSGANAGSASAEAESSSANAESAKIASLGLRVARGVSYHGVSLNTGLDASVFDCIVTCGVRGERVTTIAAETGVLPDDHEVATRLAGHIVKRMQGTPRRSACQAPLQHHEDPEAPALQPRT